MMDFELVGRKAIAVFSAEIAVKQAKQALWFEFDAYKEKTLGDAHIRIDADSPEWAAMIEATQEGHEKLRRANMDLRNAKSRLSLQIRRGLGDTSRITS